MTKKSFKDEVAHKLFFVFLCLLGVGILVFLKSTQIIFAGIDSEASKNHRVKIDTISGPRGDIMSDDYSLLSTTITNFNAYIDINVPAITNKLFKENVDSLSIKLDSLFVGKNYDYYKKYLLAARKDKKDHYKLLAKNLTHSEMRALKKFPIFERGRYKGGLIIEPRNLRKRPFKSLAKRTLGDEKYVRQANDSTFRKKSIGIEGYYNQYLEGEKKGIVKYLGPGSKWIPLYDASGMPERGYDIKTSLNVHLQDITEKALLKQLEEHQADHGCAIVMEVATGQVKAIANLSRLENGAYGEIYNVAIGRSSAPGSTMKLATLMALLEEANVSLNETVNIGDGKIKYYNKVLRDSGGKPKKSILTLREVIEKSSNVGTAKFVMKYFNSDEGKKAFTDKFNDFLLTQKTGIDINGEPYPIVRNPKMKEWSGISLPWLSVGYEANLTPLQVLSFYNAIANNGVYMKPYVTTQILENGLVVKEFEPQAVKRICSEKNAGLLKDVLVGAVNNGTGKGIKLPHVQLAGKTGTAKILESKDGYKHLYQASFAGFFPAEKPKYSCIVVVHHPTSGQYYGSQVAAPVFKDIAEHFYMHRETPTVNYNDSEYANRRTSKPDCKTALTHDLTLVMNEMGIPHSKLAEGDWSIVVQSDNENLVLRDRKLVEGKEVPNVRGMGLKDAIYILENYGLTVSVEGAGKVVSQSLTPGARFNYGDNIKVDLR